MKLKKEDLKRIIIEEVNKILDEVSPSDEKMIFHQMIRDVAKDIIVTHKQLTPAQQETYENMLVMAGQELANKREQDTGSL
jgi:glycerol-3-phosphate cytidylyltransferase-like family protein|tara:strand:+ start:1647 stop:1889 length:243 start_codon:yes stop_codon:yes gene_type:complete